jgi:hypothetical protein
MGGKVSRPCDEPDRRSPAERFDLETYDPADGEVGEPRRTVNRRLSTELECSPVIGTDKVLLLAARLE